MIKRFCGLYTILCGLLISIMVTNASAHEKWFHETESYGLRWDLFFRPLPLVLFGAVLLITLVAGSWWRRRGRGFVSGPENFGTENSNKL
ncbi:MAG: hypothetical protein LC768_02680 [Acidobacteria bacterium]|nr:hypothetical protein [Acidobacteriota bacterium]MCA1637238.1 hypothetical protein [Acidobacteriota bacterium]